MIPFIVPPLAGLSVLVTRPQGQTAGLCASIQNAGGEAIEFPTLSIEPRTAAPPIGRYDLIAFVSVNAVKHGASLIQTLIQETRPRIAVLGQSSANALSELGIGVDILPEYGNSESLLAHPMLVTPPQRVLIVKGSGGRELLFEVLTAGGAQVEQLEVYERNIVDYSAEHVARLEARWRDRGIDVVTATSGDTLTALTQILTAEGLRLLRDTPLLVVSERVRDAACALGLRGECILSPGADDQALIGALAYWRTRAR